MMPNRKIEFVHPQSFTFCHFGTKWGQNGPKWPLLGTKSCVFGGSEGLPGRIGLVPVRVFRTLLDGEVRGWCNFFIGTVKHCYADVTKRVVFGRIMTRGGRF